MQTHSHFLPQVSHNATLMAVAPGSLKGSIFGNEYWKAEKGDKTRQGLDNHACMHIHIIAIVEDFQRVLLNMRSG